MSNLEPTSDNPPTGPARLPERERLIFSHFLAGGAADLNTTVRAYSHGELVLIVADRMQLGIRPFRLRGSSIGREAAHAFVDLVVERRGFRTVMNDFGGSMHWLERDRYARLIEELCASDPIVCEARREGADFWSRAFAQASPT